MNECHVALLYFASGRAGGPPVVIFVVEDDRPINLMASNALSRAGYEAISAHSADEAIEILRARKDIRLLFTDIDMPGSMDGLKFAASVRDKWPPIHVIITSGMKTPAALPERRVFVRKPHRTSHLLQTIADLAA
jgi:DNA-binding NtrC family response regulator